MNSPQSTQEKEASSSVGGNCEPKHWKNWEAKLGTLKQLSDKQQQEATATPRADIGRRRYCQSLGMRLPGRNWNHWEWGLPSETLELEQGLSGGSFSHGDHRAVAWEKKERDRRRKGKRERAQVEIPYLLLSSHPLVSHLCHLLNVSNWKSLGRGPGNSLHRSPSPLTSPSPKHVAE